MRLKYSKAVNQDFPTMTVPWKYRHSFPIVHVLQRSQYGHIKEMLWEGIINLLQKPY